MSIDNCSSIARQYGVSERAVMHAWKMQNGFCRFTGFPFSSGDFQPVIVQRKFALPLSDTNFCIVISKIEKLRAATGENWRTFVRSLQFIAKEIDM